MDNSSMLYQNPDAYNSLYINYLPLNEPYYSASQLYFRYFYDTPKNHKI